MKGSKIEMISYVPQMTVRRCDNSKLEPGDLPCRSESEIDEYIKDMQIDLWVYQKEVDFKEYKAVPIFNTTTTQNINRIRKDSSY